MWVLDCVSTASWLPLESSRNLGQQSVYTGEGDVNSNDPWIEGGMHGGGRGDNHRGGIYVQLPP